METKRRGEERRGEERRGVTCGAPARREREGERERERAICDSGHVK